MNELEGVEESNKEKQSIEGLQGLEEANTSRIPYVIKQGMQQAAEHDKNRSIVQSDLKYETFSLTPHPLRWMSASTPRYRKCVLFLNIIVVILLLILVGKSGVFGADFHFSHVNKGNVQGNSRAYKPYFIFWNRGLGSAQRTHMNLEIHIFIPSSGEYQLRYQGYDVGNHEDSTSFPGRLSGSAAEMEVRPKIECTIGYKYSFVATIIWDGGSETIIGSFSK